MNDQQHHVNPEDNSTPDLLRDDPDARRRWFEEQRGARMVQKPPYYTELTPDKLKLDGENLSLVILFTDDTEEQVEEVRQMVARLKDPNIHIFPARVDHPGQTVVVAGFTEVVPSRGLGGILFGSMVRIGISATTGTTETALVAAVHLARSMVRK